MIDWALDRLWDFAVWVLAPCLAFVSVAGIVAHYTGQSIAHVAEAMLPWLALGFVLGFIGVGR